MVKLRFCAVCLMFRHLVLQRMTSFVLGSFESVSTSKCEYQDANLIWRNTPAYSLNDVKAMAWYKGKDSLMASWLEGKGFREYPPYNGRLMQIGETGIKIKVANRTDNGSYWLSLTLASTDHKLEAVTHLDVIVAPSSKCKPNIVAEGSILKAEVPSEWCGTPPLSPKWKNTGKTLIHEAQNQSLLVLGGDFEAGEYIVCAEGNSAICYHGNITDLCTVIIIESQHGRRNDGWTPNPESIILPIVIVGLMAVSIVALVLWKRKLFCRNRNNEQMYLATEDKPAAKECPQTEEIPLMEEFGTSREGPHEIQSYLLKLYNDMTKVSLSPTGKETFVDVSEVYIDLDFQQMETRDLKYTETDLSWTASYTVSGSNEDTRILKAHRSPIIIIGSGGSGKSTWCKHLVHCWSDMFKNDDINVQDKYLSNLGEYQILLYLPLKPSDRGHSFQELLKHYLFQEQPEYLKNVKEYIYAKSDAQSVLILIDGLDNISENVKPIKLVSELLDHKLLASSTVIFTCRPSGLKRNFNAYVDTSIQLEVFNVCQIPPERSAVYASKVLRILNQHQKDCDNFLAFTRNLHVQSLLQLPYLCLMILFVWMENKNPYIEITDILLSIVEHILDTEETVTRCNTNILKLSQRNFAKLQKNVVTKLDERFVKIRDLMYELSMTTEEIFLSKSKILTKKERLSNETSTIGRDTLPLEVLSDIGLITESEPLQSVKSLSTLTFTNVLFYQLFVSMAIAFKKGHIFKYIVSDLQVAMKHSMIIHMLWQFSPKLGKKCFVNLRTLKPNPTEKLCLVKENNKFICSITKISMKRQYHQVTWLQLLMCSGNLDDDKLLFLTDALKSMDSLSSLVLENSENNVDLVFWLPCSQTLKKLTLNINKCTLLLCPEWNKLIPFQLKEVIIKSVIMTSRDCEILSKVLISCKCIADMDITPTVVGTSDNALLPYLWDLKHSGGGSHEASQQSV